MTVQLLEPKPKRRSSARAGTAASAIFWGSSSLCFVFNLFFRQGFLYSRLTSNSRPSSCLSLECWSNNREAPGSGSYSLRANKTRTFYLWRVCRGVCAEDSFWEALLFLLEVLGGQIKAFGFGGN